jgi:hypothetical protein
MNKVGEYISFGRPDFSSEEIDVVARVVHSGWVGIGPPSSAPIPVFFTPRS